jgi:hypothetical protein
LTNFRRLGKNITQNHLHTWGHIFKSFLCKPSKIPRLKF